MDIVARRIQAAEGPLGGTTCLTLLCLYNAASFVLCVLHCVQDHHKLLHYSPRLKNTCIGQVVLDKLLSLKSIISNQSLYVISCHVILYHSNL